MKNFLKRFATIAAFIATMATLTPATAGGVAITLTPSSSSTSPQDVTIAWTSTAQYATGTTITVTTDPAFTSIRDNCSGTVDIDLNDDATADGSITATTTNSATFTVTTSTGADQTMSLCLQFAFGATARNYSVTIISSNPVDFGSALLYANGGNQVTVSATVPATLSFAIRDAGDTTDTNTCALGSLGLSSTSTCAYRLRIATNASNGFQASIQANQVLGTGSATMTNVVNDGAQPVAGTERYGIARVQAATEGGRNTTTLAFTEPIVENNPALFTFGTDPSPVPTSTSQSFISYNAAFQTGGAASVTTTSFVEHAASISAGTSAGYYSQVVTYTVTGSY
ncbi:hypothetical protein KJ781_03460 [Patescibacteria group bacterium]|nr:hypothetical protein [Patescibacteria group bacterium]MBU1448683.1 hypothetical protein [Patescibacteria group bacterium]MBU2613346.1 hypothetical protein [Patescibacteria group bacterium]